MLFFDEDSNARYFLAEAGLLKPENLDPIVDDLAGTDVKNLVIGTAIAPGTMEPNAFLHGFELEKGPDQPWFRGKPSPVLYRHVANVSALRKMGVDSSSYLLKRAKEKGMTAWITVRMNDQHGTWDEQSPGRPKLWKEHPELRTRTCAPQSGLSYEHAAVRDAFFNVIKTNLEFYDFDGIVLDWMRHVPHFDDGDGEHYIPLMNDYLHDIRKLVDSYAEKRNHKILIACRVPATVASAKYHGLDGVAWAKKGYVDRLIISPKYVRSYMLDASRWKKAIGISGFPVTACIDTPYQPYPGYPANTPAGTWTREPFDRRQLPFIRGACRVALGNQSDGIYLFNFMNIRNRKKMMEIFDECGSRENLQGKNFSIDISYDDLDMDEPNFLKGWRASSNDAWFSIWRKKQKEAGTYPYQLPQSLLPEQCCRFHFFTGKVPERSPLIAFTFEGLDAAEVVFDGRKCDFKDGRFLMTLDQFTGNSADITVKNRSGHPVEILRASMHFSWDGNFPELYDSAKKTVIGVAADI